MTFISGSRNGAGFAHFLTQRKAQVGLKTIDRLSVFQCDTLSHAPCMIFWVKELAAATPRPKDDTKPKDPGAGPSDDPNTKEDTTTPDPPGMLPQDHEIKHKRPAGQAPEKRNFVRECTFRFDSGNTEATTTRSRHAIMSLLRGPQDIRRYLVPAEAMLRILMCNMTP